MDLLEYESFFGASNYLDLLEDPSVYDNAPTSDNSQTSIVAKEKRTAERRTRFFCEACISKVPGGWKLVDPDTNEKKDWLRVEVDLSDEEKVSAKLGNALTLRAYAVTSTQHRIVVRVACDDVNYKLALAASGKVPSDAHYFCLVRSRGDVFHLHLVKQGNTEPKPPRDNDNVRREANFVSLLRRAKKSKNWDEAETLLEKFYGDTAYIYGLWQSREDIQVGDVIARVLPHNRKQQVCVTKRPDTSECTILSWGVVANHETTPGFNVELPQPVVRNPHGRPANFVAIATQGIVAVMTKGTSVAGQWLLASGNGDGFAIADVGCNDVDLSLRRLGKVQSVGDGCVFVEVNFENNVLRPDKAMEAPQNVCSEEKSKVCLKEGNELRTVDGNNLLKAIKVYKRGLRDDSSAYIRALLCCAISSCYLTLEKFEEKAKKFAKRATRLCAIHSDSFFLLAQAYLALNVAPKAQMSINRATAMCPDREDYVELAKKIQLAMRDLTLGRAQRDDLDHEKASEIDESIMRQRHPDLTFKDVRKSGHFETFISNLSSHKQLLLKMELLMKDRRYKEAIEFGESLISERHAGVIFNLSNLYSSGVGGVKKPKEAIDLLWVVAGVKDDGPAEERLNGVAEAKGVLAEYLFHGHPFVQRDTSRAYKMAYEGAIRGAHNAQNMLGLCLQGRGDFSEALDWFRISAEGDGMTSGGQTDSAAIVNAAMLFLNGHGTLRNPHRALRYLQRASQIGHHCHDDMVAKLRQVLKGKSAYMSYDAMMQKLPPDVKAMFASLQKMNEPALVMRANVKLDLVPQCANASPYGKSLASAFYTWKVGIGMLERNVDVGKALKLMAQALEVDNIMCPVVEGLQKTLVRNCNDVLAREPKNRDALFLLAYTKIQASHEWIALCDHALKLFPNDAGLIYMYGSALSFQKQFVESEAIFSRAVKLFPNDADFHYAWASGLRFIGKETQAKPQFLEYLKLAPIDHRKRPNALYRLAILSHFEGDAEGCKMYLKQAEEAEKLQLPPFLPSDCYDKLTLHALGLIRSPGHEKDADFKPVVRRNRIIRRVRKENREWTDSLESLDSKGSFVFASHGRAQPISPNPINWSALEQIVLLDFVPMEDKVHEGCFMELTVINHPVRKTATHFLVQDQNMDVEPMAIYCAPDFKIRQGDRLQVARPYQRTSVDLRSNIRVDDLKTVRLVGFNQICSYCCKPAPKLSRCARCKVALYCCAAHQKRDWEELDHKIECKRK
jgi:tetratricopeptide (TPR) repeat protein